MSKYDLFAAKKTLHELIADPELSDWRCELVAAKLAAGADVNAVDANGDTPLHVAVANLRAKAARQLLLAGADPLAHDAQGRTPIARMPVIYRGFVAGQLVFDLLRVMAVVLPPHSWPLAADIETFLDSVFPPDASWELRCGVARMLVIARGTLEPVPVCLSHDPDFYEEGVDGMRVALQLTRCEMFLCGHAPNDDECRRV